MDSDVTEDQASLTVRFLEDQAQKLQSNTDNNLRAKSQHLK